MGIKEEIEEVIENGFELKEKHSKIINISKESFQYMPLWVFEMLVKLFILFIENKKDVTFSDMVHLDREASGYSDYNKQLLYRSLDLFYRLSYKE